jgi:hypothetical protein
VDRLGRIPAFEVSESRSLGHELTIAIGHNSGRNVTIGERIAGDERIARRYAFSSINRLNL